MRKVWAIGACGGILVAALLIRMRLESKPAPADRKSTPQDSDALPSAAPPPNLPASSITGAPEGASGRTAPSPEAKARLDEVRRPAQEELERRKATMRSLSDKIRAEQVARREEILKKRPGTGRILTPEVRKELQRQFPPPDLGPVTEPDDSEPPEQPPKGP